MTLGRIFDSIYRRNVWQGVESLSGPGSGSASTYNVKAALLAFLDVVGAKSMLDVGCGDGFWMPDLPGAHYVGLDVSEFAVSAYRKARPDREVFVYSGGPLPDADVVFSRDVLQHLALNEGMGLLHQMRAAAQGWLILSTYLDRPHNTNKPIRSGLDERGRDTFTHINLMASPFNMPAPIFTIPDGWGWNEPNEVRDVAKVLGVWKQGGTRM